jgi:hypothetical protein
MRPLRFVSVIVPIVIAACSDGEDGDLFGGSRALSGGGSSNASGSTVGLSGGRPSGNGGSATSSGGKSAAIGGAPSVEGGRTGGGSGGAPAPLGGTANAGSGGSNASSGGSKASSGGTASGGVATGGGGPAASGGVNPSGGSQAKGGATASGGSPIATGGSFAGDDCLRARAALNDALESAQACDPGSEKQCLGFVEGECCPVAVNDPDSEATANFSAALAKWQKACGGAVCLTALCLEPTVAACQSQGLGAGRCVAGLSL